MYIHFDEFLFIVIDDLTLSFLTTTVNSKKGENRKLIKCNGNGLSKAIKSGRPVANDDRPVVNNDCYKA